MRGRPGTKARSCRRSARSRWWRCFSPSCACSA
jgi:hypothetical protein